MKTPDELLDLASQGKMYDLDRLAAEVQGWIEQPAIYGDYYDELNNKSIDNYHPTRDKAQAWTLADKAGIGINFIGDGTAEVTHDKLKNGLYLESTEIAVTIAFILAMQGEE